MAVVFGDPVSAAGIAAVMGQSASLTYKLPMILGSSGAPASVTGTLSETALATITVPANTLGISGGLRITAYFTYTNSGNNKVLRIRYSGASGTSYFSNTFTTTAAMQAQAILFNNGATNAQKGINSGGSPFGTSSAVTSSVDTTADTTVVITGTLANTGETITLESYTVEFLPKV